MHPQVKTGTFIATGSDVNLDLGFIPAYARFFNANAAANEVIIMDYFNLAGDAKEFWTYVINDAGSTTAASIVKNSSGGYLSEYDSVTAAPPKHVCTFDYTGGAAEDLITCSVAADCPSNGQTVKFVEDGGLATGLTELINYYVINSGTYGSGTFQVSLTPGGSAVEMSSDGTPTNYFRNMSESVPNQVGGKGLTVDSSFAADGDVVFYVAMQADRDEDLGDAAEFLA